jgi:virulence-associated protein VagC
MVVTQAVRLPKDVAFPDGVKSVTVLREGNRRVIVPSDAAAADHAADVRAAQERRDAVSTAMTS